MICVSYVFRGDKSFEKDSNIVSVYTSFNGTNEGKAISKRVNFFMDSILIGSASVGNGIGDWIFFIFFGIEIHCIMADIDIVNGGWRRK